MGLNGHEGHVEKIIDMSKKVQKFCFSAKSGLQIILNHISYSNEIKN